MASPVKDKHMFACEIENAYPASYTALHALDASHASPHASHAYKDVEHIVWHPVRKVGTTGLGLMRFEKSTLENACVSSPLKKKLRVDHKTSPHFNRHREETHPYELSIDMPEPPKVKRVTFE
jgi:hypothetical protein